MMNLLRNRLVALFAALLVTMALLAGCGGAKTEPTPAPAPAPAPAAPAPAPAPPVDKGAIITEAAKAYFNALPPNQNMWEGADLKAKVEAKDTSIFLVDIRKPEDFAKGHIPGAINIPFAELGKNFDKLPKDKQIVLNCYSGQTSGQSIAVLKMAGFNAVSLKGGFPTWEKVGGEVKK